MKTNLEIQNHNKPNMSDLNTWTEITDGIYKYQIDVNFAYEIHILYWHHNTNIITARASLYLLDNRKSKKVLTRTCISDSVTLDKCIEDALQHKRNMILSQFK
jgi:hypothetical protein